MGEYSFNLTLYSSVLDGKNIIQEITSIAQAWRRSIRLVGGYWQGTFKLTGPAPDLADYYDRWLGCHLEEQSEGEKTWEGMIYEMTFNDGRTSRRRSLDDMFNFIIVSYTTTADPPVVGDTDPGTNDESISRYGRKEDRVAMDNFDLDPAEQRRDSELKWCAYPWSRPTGGDLAGSKATEKAKIPSLDVSVCGYVFTINWRFTTTADESTADLSDWISDILAADSQFVVPGDIQINKTQLKRKLDIPSRCWDHILKLVSLGDSSFNPYYARVVNDRRLEYGQVNFSPYYYVIDGQVTRNLQSKQDINPWKVRPAIFRDLSYPSERADAGSPFQQARDFLTEEITVGAESGLSWSPADYDETEILAAQQEYEEWLKNLENEETTGGGGSSERLNWKRRYGLTPGTPGWEEATRMGRAAWEQKYGKGKKKGKG